MVKKLQFRINNFEYRILSEQGREKHAASRGPYVKVRGLLSYGLEGCGKKEDKGFIEKRQTLSSNILPMSAYM